MTPVPHTHESPASSKTPSHRFLDVWSLSILGVILVVPIWIGGIVPRLLSLPHDFTYEADVISVDDAFDESLHEFHGEEYSETVFRYDVVGEMSGALLVRNLFDVRAKDGSSIFRAEPVYAIDPRTWQHVARPSIPDRQGSLFAPRGLRKGEPFLYWHVNADRPATMQFVVEEELYGLSVYRYETDYGGAIDQTAFLQSIPGVGEWRGIRLLSKNTLWIEPVSGYLVKQEDESTLYEFYDLKTGASLGPYHAFHNVFAEDAVRLNVTRALHAKWKVLAFHWIVPLLLICLAGVLLLLRLGKHSALYRAWWHTYGASVCIASPLLGLTLFAYSMSVEWAQERAYASFDAEARDAASTLSNGLDSVTNILRAGAALWHASEEVTRDEWHRFVASLDLSQTLPSIQGMGYARVLQPGDRERIEDAVRAEGFPSFRIFPTDGRTPYTTIMYLEPFDERNQRAFGFDMFSESTRRRAMILARDSGMPTLSGKVRLLQENGGEEQAGSLLYVPVYRRGVPLDTQEQRAAAIQGYVYAPIRIGDFIDETFAGREMHLDFHLYDGLKTQEQTLMYDRVHGLDVDATIRGAYYRRRDTIPLSQHFWTLEFVGIEDRDIGTFERYVPMATLVIGCVLSLFMTLLFIAIFRSRERAVRYAEQVNDDLYKSRNELWEKNKHIEKQFQELERMNALMVGRELKMRQLKEQLGLHPSEHDSSSSHDSRS